jgi:hypothetical protein
MRLTIDVAFSVADVDIALRGDVCCYQRPLRHEIVTGDIFCDGCIYFLGVFGVTSGFIGQPLSQWDVMCDVILGIAN